MSTAMKHTKQVDGFRWELLDASCYSGIISARPQQRCTTDSGKVYYRNCEPKAQFDTIADRERFLAAFTAKQWAVRHDAITV